VPLEIPEDGEFALESSGTPDSPVVHRTLSGGTPDSPVRQTRAAFGWPFALLMNPTLDLFIG
jgi:hypothetical protein